MKLENIKAYKAKVSFLSTEEYDKVLEHLDELGFYFLDPFARCYVDYFIIENGCYGDTTISYCDSDNPVVTIEDILNLSI